MCSWCGEGWVGKHQLRRRIDAMMDEQPSDEKLAAQWWNEISSPRDSKMAARWLKKWQPGDWKKWQPGDKKNQQPGDIKYGSPVIKKNGTLPSRSQSSLSRSLQTAPLLSKHGLIFAQTAASNPSKTWTDLLWKQQPRITLKHGLISFENSSPLFSSL